MEKVIYDVETTKLKDVSGNVHWDSPMDKEMAALDVNETLEL